MSLFVILQGVENFYAGIVANTPFSFSCSVPERRTAAVHVRDGHRLPVRAARYARLVGGDQPIAAPVRQRQQLPQLAGTAAGRGAAVRE